MHYDAIQLHASLLSEAQRFDHRHRRMAMTPLQLAMAFTLKEEGKFTIDDGGPTMHGVTQHTYDAYRKAHGLPFQTVEFISTHEVQDIMQNEYWLPAHCDVMPTPLAICMFDWNYNTYPGHAMKDLQVCLGVEVDGLYGPNTAAAISAASSVGLVAKFLDVRRAWYNDAATTNPNRYAKYLNDWLKRVDNLQDYIKDII